MQCKLSLAKSLTMEDRMAKKQIHVFLSSLTAAIHFGFVLVYVASIFLLFLSKSLKLYIALFFCLIWVQQKIFNGCSLTKLEGYLLKKGGKGRDDAFFFNRFAHNLFKKRLRTSLSRVEMLFQGMLLFFFIVSAVIIILHL